MYGYLRLTILLKFGIVKGLIYQLMCEQRPNLIKTLSDKSKVLLTDITYISVNQKWVYLASLYNPETRRVVVYKIGEHMTKELATSVIESQTLQKLGTMIIHSDIGSQYTSDLFEKTLSKYNIKHSYSKKGCDNARIESFHLILKREHVHFQSF